jgi:hypothetical protein
MSQEEPGVFGEHLANISTGNTRNTWVGAGTS